MVLTKRYFGDNKIAVTTLVVTVMLSIIVKSSHGTSHTMDTDGGENRNLSLYTAIIIEPVDLCDCFSLN